MGTPPFAAASLRALLERGHEVVAVFTQPDRPAGRGQAARMSAVKELALERGLAVEQPEKLRNPAVVERLRALGPEAIVVAAYGKILPKPLLDVPPRGAINVHASLLPRHRGAAPIQRALLAGDTETGITIMQMNERMDAGDILIQEPMPIRDDDTSETLGARLAAAGARLIVDALDRLARGEVVPQRQNDQEATLAPMVRKEEGAIDWRRGASEIARAVRAFWPWPGAYTTLAGRRMKIHRAAPLTSVAGGVPGTVVHATGDRLEVATGDGRLALLEVQLEGRRRLTAREFLAGRSLQTGDRLG
ncbi:MAG: methionyl-tRNA formyltransferase [Candidatus Binatia bacterium]